MFVKKNKFKKFFIFLIFFVFFGIGLNFKNNEKKGFVETFQVAAFENKNNKVKDKLNVFVGLLEQEVVGLKNFISTKNIIKEDGLKSNLLDVLYKLKNEIEKSKSDEYLVSLLYKKASTIAENSVFTIIELYQNNSFEFLKTLKSSMVLNKIIKFWLDVEMNYKVFDVVLKKEKSFDVNILSNREENYEYTFKNVLKCLNNISTKGMYSLFCNVLKEVLYSDFNFLKKIPGFEATKLKLVFNELEDKILSLEKAVGVNKITKYPSKKQNNGKKLFKFSKRGKLKGSRKKVKYRKISKKNGKKKNKERKKRYKKTKIKRKNVA